MDIAQFIEQTVHSFYWEQDANCARTTLYTLATLAKTELSPDIWDAATGMHGAGRFGAQCGLVEGMLMFIGIQGCRQGLNKTQIGAICYQYAQAFTNRFGSLECRILRPGGFQNDDPPHACQKLTVRTIMFAVDFFNNKPEFNFLPQEK